MPPTQEFNWHDYIILRDSDPPNAEDRKQLEDMLERIAQTPDGQALIKKAYDVSGSGENKIVLSTVRLAETSKETRNGGDPVLRMCRLSLLERMESIITAAG